MQIAVADDLPPIEADVEYLTAAVECLVENAIKFTDRPGREVVLHAYQDGDYLCLAVSDQGRGIPSHEIGNIFKPFYQIERERYEDQGAGSGLAIVKSRRAARRQRGSRKRFWRGQHVYLAHPGRSRSH